MGVLVCYLFVIPILGISGGTFVWSDAVIFLSLFVSTVNECQGQWHLQNQNSIFGGYVNSISSSRCGEQMNIGRWSFYFCHDAV
jgi:hypothetical protein